MRRLNKTVVIQCVSGEAPLEEMCHVGVDVWIGRPLEAVVLVRVPLKEEHMEYLLTQVHEENVTDFNNFSLFNMTFRTCQMTHHGLKVHVFLHQSFRDLCCLLEVDIVWKNTMNRLSIRSD